jgi:hypothetical protein
MAMAMINANVMKAVGETLESHGIRLQPGESVPDALARALNLNDTETHRWIELLSQGSTVEDANAQVGIADHRDRPLLVTIARAVGTAVGKIVGEVSSSADRIPSANRSTPK